VQEQQCSNVPQPVPKQEERYRCLPFEARQPSIDDCGNALAAVTAAAVGPTGAGDYLAQPQTTQTQVRSQN
jgi:hypothetical protein